MHANIKRSPCFNHPRQLNLFLAVLKTKFAKAQSLLADRRKQKVAAAQERHSSIVRVLGWARKK